MSNSSNHHYADWLDYSARLTKALNELGPQPPDAHLVIELWDGDEGDRLKIGEWIDEHGGEAWAYIPENLSK